MSHPPTPPQYPQQGPYPGAGPYSQQQVPYPQQGSYPPGPGYPGQGYPGPPRPPMTPERRAAVLGYIAGALGLMSFIWGFLDWYSGGNDQGIAGYSFTGGGATAVVACSLIAGLLAAAEAFERRRPALGPALIALASVFLVIGVVAAKDAAGAASLDLSAGAILELITCIAQAVLLGFNWLSTSGRLPANGPTTYPPGPPGGPPSPPPHHNPNDYAGPPSY